MGFIHDGITGSEGNGEFFATILYGDFLWDKCANITGRHIPTKAWRNLWGVMRNPSSSLKLDFG